MSYKVVKINNIYKVPKINNVYKAVYEAEVTPTPVGIAYRNDVEYTGNDLNDKTYLLKAGTPGQISSFDMTKSFEFLATNVQWNGSSTSGGTEIFMSIKTGGGNSRSARFKILSETIVRAEIYSVNDITIPIQPNIDYDYQIKYSYSNNVGTLTLSYKASDSDTWLVGTSENVILTAGTTNNFISIGNENGLISGALDGVTFKNDGNILFQR